LELLASMFIIRFFTCFHVFLLLLCDQK
jgi:hypothetical protein